MMIALTAHVLAALAFSLLFVSGLGLVGAMILRDLPQIRAALAPGHMAGARPVRAGPVRPAGRTARLQAGSVRGLRLAAAA
ncbi:hypothetical protein GVO57_10755 [Sphingomonas changnyeongensis]|uniref:Uncharacterized protein n=1 Tax=Sphingomonas changnyeongensis TaxID=2698679 RepID=A0A7Z2NWQ7_9SPHN|nr:hypothetical protein [Sphingomonas changnyeongensis]QHL91205.1 hypothetical protein GVO57_10755 [Sphingomonas changnyeongensis]